MTTQSDAWSNVAERYESEFVDPYTKAKGNPLLPALDAVGDASAKVAADLGCGIGPLLPHLSARFARVHAVDFAPGMLVRARENCAALTNIEYHQLALTDLSTLAGQVDVACAINSLIQPDVEDLEKALKQIRAILKPGGQLFAIVPAVDGLHYQTMLLLDRARQTGMPYEMARKNAAQHGEHHLYDFAFGEFRYLGLHQHFWQPFEIAYRLRRAGLRPVRRAKVRLSWKQFARGTELRRYPAPWDWFFQAEVPS